MDFQDRQFLPLGRRHIAFVVVAALAWLMLAWAGAAHAKRMSVARTRQPDDGRVVLVSLTESGKVALEDYRERVGSVLGGYLRAEMSDDQVEALATATETLARLVDLLQQRSS